MYRLDDLKISPELTLANSAEPFEQQKRALCSTIYLEVGLEVGSGEIMPPCLGDLNPMNNESEGHSAI